MFRLVSTSASFRGNPSSIAVCRQSRSFSSTQTKDYEMLLVEKKADRVALVQLNRPKSLNALCQQLVNELEDAFMTLDKDKDVGCIVLTGDKKAFAAGADIKEMEKTSYVDNYMKDTYGSPGEFFRRIRTPIIAAVNGYALGGGCELAMMCDLILAGDSAKFGQPEITLGTIPGLGGSQRLTRFVGKSKAMELVLTGERISAQEAQQIGLVARVFPADELLVQTFKMAAKIASFSKPVVAMAKEAVNKAYETTLQEGLLGERRLFHSTFALEDQKEGMNAFVSKRAPKWNHK